MFQKRMVVIGEEKKRHNWVIPFVTFLVILAVCVVLLGRDKKKEEKVMSPILTIKPTMTPTPAPHYKIMEVCREGMA